MAIKSLLRAFLLITALVSVALAAEIKSPDYIEGVTKVDAGGVIELTQRFQNLVIVDSRIPGDRRKGYIESSVSLPDTKTNCQSLTKIIPDKMRPALFYCNGIKCGRSAIAIEIAKKCGYRELYWFRGGFEDWMKNGFPFVKY